MGTNGMYKHGDAADYKTSSEYDTWKAMKQRCNNPKNKWYKNYGGRGIKICKRWNDSYINFLQDMGRRPKGLSIDRTDNNKGYSPENCRWANRREQAINNRRSRKMTYQGQTLSAIEWSEKIGIPVHIIYGRRHLLWSDERALSQIFIRRK